jgi:lysophospholipase L1-like esterase
LVTSESDFRVMRPRLEAAITTHRPDLLLCQCPTGPAAYFVRYPPWVRRLRRLYALWFDRLHERRIRAEMTQRNGARRDALYDGRHLDAVYRWRPAAWPVTRHLNGLLAARYGVTVKATRERYLELMRRQCDRIREQTSAPVLFLGLLPHSDFFYPGYRQRAVQSSADLALVLERPAEGFYYLDVLQRLERDGGSDRLLLSDGTHLSRAGHGAIAALVTERLVPLARVLEETRPDRGADRASSETRAAQRAS